ncbi:MAG: GNAT family N-acetyltransferase [Cardiobacteriaceae bacterium]|nr:GNAT family N-acetyltransferase [Cardiobacteriaceae bacterium]
MRRLILIPRDALPTENVFGLDLNPADYRRYLGQTRHALYWDATHGLYPNAFAALAATLADGCNLHLHLPEHYPAADPDHFRLADYGTDLSTCHNHFNRRLKHFISQNSDTEGISTNQDNIEHCHQPQIILGRRGRGKTTRLADKIQWLGAVRILIITPYRSNLERLRALLPPNTLHTYLPPDDALNRLPPADHLIIDEAAAIPPAQLLALTTHYPAYTLASSEDGYEGDGRRFSLHTLPLLIARDAALIYRHQHALRHAHQDSLEQLLDNTFLLQPELPAAVAPQRIYRVAHTTYAHNEKLLRAIYALLHQAHYRTSPEDLKRLLDLPKQSLYIAANANHITGVLHILHETPLPYALAQAVQRGERRPQGRLLIQQLLQRTQNPYWNQTIARISRIAVHPEQRRQGIAAALINTALKDITTPLGVSYKHRDDLAAFWQALAFTEIHRSPSGHSLRLHQ